jgi:hypothetical protein
VRAETILQHKVRKKSRGLVSFIIFSGRTAAHGALHLVLDDVLQRFYPQMIEGLFVSCRWSNRPH